MKKTLLIIINFVTCVISLPAQILYSVTPEGGKYGYGTIGKFLPATNELTVVKSFGPVESEGVKPSGTLVVATDVKLYGMTTNGGSSGVGVIFSFDPNSSTLTKLKDFNDADGARPNGSLIQASDGKLYGMTTNGGSGEAGVIFSFDPSTSTYAWLHKFDWYNEGGNPSGSLVQASDGKLYGMTPNGGSSRAGVIFSFDPSTFTYAKLSDFDYYNAGGNPNGNLIQASDGKLYGMTANGGSNGAGAIFSFDPVSSTLKKLKDFEQTTGGSYGSLVQASDGKLYGTTRSNGQSGNPDVIPGVIFSFDPSTSIYTKLYDFDPDNDGGGSFGSLMQASDGKLYGMTTAGEPNGGGVIFSFDPSISRYTKLIDYTATNGAYAGLGSAFIELKECIVADSTWYKDGDGDGYGNPAYRVKACPRPAGYVANNTDCNDNNKAVHAPVTYYRDFDRDGFGDPFTSIAICSDTLPAGYVRNNYDCHDNEGASDPGLVLIRMCTGEWTQCVYVKDTAEKLSQGWTIGVCPLQSCGPDETLMCNNGIQECVKSTDVASKLAEAGGKWSLGPYCGGAHISTCNEKDTTYYRDYDSDGFGDPNHPITVSACTHPVGYVVNNADCNDSNKLVHATVTYYRDFDGDGFGDLAHPINASACTPPAGYVINNIDCNDNNKAVHGNVTYYRDFDGDGFGDPDQFTSTCSNTPPAGYVKNNYDCNDGEGASQPGNVKIRMCHNGSAECVYVKDTAEKLSQGWSLGVCSPILYSMTTSGGKYGYGTINKFLPATNELIVVKSFGPAESDGVTPAGTPVEATNGKLYGMTRYGGTYGFGTIFSFDPATSMYTKLKDFDNAARGIPYGSLIQASDGKLYGMTCGYFSSSWYGVLFSFDPSSLSYNVLKEFDGKSGANPVGSLVQASNGKLYGMTLYGGSYGRGLGVLFSFDPFSGTYTKLEDFDEDGGQPWGSLMQASDGKLYGTNLAGKEYATDNIFSFDIITSTYKKLFGFEGNPNGSLIQATNGKLFGMTTSGGPNDGYGYGNGTIFNFDIVSQEFKVLWAFDTAAGLHPWGHLMEATDGKLYGLAHEGGSSKMGTIFSYVPSANKLTKLTDFNGTNGSYPGDESAFIEVADCPTRVAYYKDDDGDGYGNPYNWKLACSQPAGYVANNTDCDDYNKAVTCCQPGVSAPVTYYRDFDQDGFGDPDHSLKDSTCNQPAGYVADNTDCNDNNKAVHAPITYYRDYDRDGFGDPYHPASFCSDVPPAGYVKNNYDCYDCEGGNQPGQARVRMCHDGWTQCVYVKDTTEKLRLGWSLGICPLQSCAGDETLMCHNGKQECVKTTDVATKLNEAGGKWSLGPFCSGVPISKSGSNSVRKIDIAVKEKSTPTQYSLSNHPNPFVGTSTIKYELPYDSKVSIKVYDLAGRAVATLVDDYKKAGTYTVNFNARNINSGSLFYKIIATSKEGQYERTNQMVKIK